MAAYLCPPAVIHGRHTVKTSQIVTEVRDRHPHAAWAPRIDAIAASTGIETRGGMLRPPSHRVAGAVCSPPASGRPGRRWPVTGSPSGTWTG